MKKIKDLQVGDIMFYAYDDKRTTDDNYSYLTSEYKFYIGKFKITHIDIITSEREDISDRYEEPIYIDRPVFKKTFKLVPDDNKAKKILKLLNTNKGIHSNNTYKNHIEFTVKGDLDKQSTWGWGTVHNLYTTYEDAYDDLASPIFDAIESLKYQYNNLIKNINNFNQSINQLQTPQKQQTKITFQLY